MSALETGLLVALVTTTPFPASRLIGWVQTCHALQSRIAKPDPTKYYAIRDAKDWKNPYLIVRRDGVELVGITPLGQSTRVEAIPGLLERLPNSAWPYGLVVAVQDIGVISQGERTRIETNRTRLLQLLKTSASK